jgi:amphi-Trp domain-containing protein
MAKKARKSEDTRTRRQSAAFEGAVSREDAAGRLEALARELRNGRLVLDGVAEHVDIAVADELTLEVKARSSASGKKSSLKLDVSWTSPKAIASEPEAGPTETEEAAPASDVEQIVEAEVAAGSASEEPAAPADPDEPNPD